MIHASLFSGIGGPEVAAAMMGWENAFHCEINPFGRAVLEYWFPNSKSYEDITKTDFREWRGKIDILTGGFPCQPFSYAGKRGGREDERYLWPEMLRVIDEVRPTWVVGENVAGITTMVEGGVLTPMGSDTTLFGEGDGLHRYELRQSFTIERICRDLEGLGYSVQPMLIPAAAVGAPHRRDRVFILAHVADPDRRDDLRVAGEHEGEGEGEGLSERHSIRKPGVANKLRSEVQGFDADAARGGHPTQEEDGGAYGDGDGQVPLKGERGEQTERDNGLSTIQRTTQNSVSDGCRLGEYEIEGSERDIRDAGAGDDERICGEEGIPASHSLSEGTRSISGSSCDKGRESSEDWGEGIRQAHGTSGSSGAVAAGLHASDPNRSRQPASASGDRFNREKSIKGGRSVTFSGTVRPRTSRSFTDTYCEGREEPQQPGWGEDSEENGTGMDDRTERFGHYGVFADPELLPENRWRDFPTVSPVHRGNDGIPFPVDCLTVPPIPKPQTYGKGSPEQYPFGKWRTETLKAYGNAIVPQVMYRIFQAIESVEE